VTATTSKFFDAVGLIAVYHGEKFVARDVVGEREGENGRGPENGEKGRRVKTNDVQVPPPKFQTWRDLVESFSARTHRLGLSGIEASTHRLGRSCPIPVGEVDAPSKRIKTGNDILKVIR